jgi:NAD(P)-dependent dehydrogenase (short-subunit alcohol dehydrogenase family)
VPTDQRLSGRVAVITGAGTGIGVGIAQRLAEDGASIVVSASNSIAGARSLADKVNKNGGSALAVEADFRDPSTASLIISSATETFGGLDILVNNAGFTLDKPFAETSLDEWTSLFNINVLAMIQTSHAALAPMSQRGRGRIINISSVHSALHTSGHVIYGATKGAVNAFSRALAIELAPKQITVNVIAPGAIYVERYDRDNRDLKAIRASIPNQKLGLPNDVASAVAYLASDEAHYVTGDVMFVDGGVTANMGVND